MLRACQHKRRQTLQNHHISTLEEADLFITLAAVLGLHQSTNPDLCKPGLRQHRCEAAKPHVEFIALENKHLGAASRLGRFVATVTSLWVVKVTGGPRYRSSPAPPVAERRYDR